MKAQPVSDAMKVKHPCFVHLVTALTIHFLLPYSSTSGANITTDQSALLALKTQIISDPYGVLENWTASFPVCNWIGVTCGARHLRVTSLNISNMDLTGSIPSEIGNLSFLVAMDITSNNFWGTLPENLARLRRLRFISFDSNNFTGEVPSWFSSFPQLEHLSISNNSFTSLKSFLLSSTNESKLAILDASFNNFGDEIPNSIGNFQNLKVLAMQGNKFSGSLPPSIMNLSSLETLQLEGNSLQGSIPLSIFNISTLKVVQLQRNSFSGTLPSNMCLGLPLLERLSLSTNQISGQIPSNVSLCSQLQIFTLSYNSITGTIPQEIGSAKMLETLYLGGNKLTGPIPPEIGNLDNLRELALERNLLTGSIQLSIFNLSFLQMLDLNRNNFSGFLSENVGNLTELKLFSLANNSFTGVIPQVLGKLTELEILYLEANRFSGPVPPSIFNISKLIELSLGINSLSGSLPTNIGASLPSLQTLNLNGNILHGVLPSSISNSSQLMNLILSYNRFNGPIPNSLGDLKFLRRLSLTNNNFTSESGSSELSFITSLTRSRFLERLRFDFNPLNSALPTAVGNLSSSLEMFTAAECKITGYIPSEIGNLSGLLILNLADNDLTGVMPSALSKLSNLQVLHVQNNGLTGFIPKNLCKLKNLGDMSLEHNHLTGSIPECLGNVSSLRFVGLNSNNLTSGIPTSIWNIQDLLGLDISSNSITGSLSPQIGNLKAVTYINLSMNMFTDNVPNTFGSLQSVIILSLAHNRFQGSIPDSMGSMSSLEVLDLSHNMFFGTIPKSLESLTHLEDLNVSFNKLYGEIPTNGPFRNFSSQSFVGNTALCGPARFHVSPCKESRHGSKKQKIFRAVFIVLGVATLMFISTMAFLIVRYCRKKKSPTVPHTSDREISPQRMSYYELLKATDGLNEDNLIGKGSFGSVYKGVLQDGTILAVKVFDMLLEVSSKTFHAECDAFRNLRHRNLIKVVSSCSNEDFKAIVLEYMPNGSLEKCLYSNNHFLDIMQRLNIMIDVASALEYLHHGYSTSVVHCDLKPSNVLVDENMVAHVSDFGITKFLGEEESKTHTRTLATLGYMAPEYGLEGRVSTKCDVYSYGITLLETFTRKRPSDEMFSGDMNLKNWVKDSLPNALCEVIDVSLLSPEEKNFNEKLSCVSSVMELALRCSADYPSERMDIRDVLAELKKTEAKLKLHYAAGTSNMQ